MLRVDALERLNDRLTEHRLQQDDVVNTLHQSHAQLATATADALQRIASVSTDDDSLY